MNDQKPTEQRPTITSQAISGSTNPSAWTFDQWLRHRVTTQLDIYGLDVGALEGDGWADFMTWNMTAATVELAELLNELRWKPWQKDRGRPNAAGRQRALVELVDVLHFIGNIATGLDITGQELTEAYLAKSEINAARQRGDGYHPKEHRRPEYSRATDDGPTLTWQCSRCGGTSTVGMNQGPTCPYCGWRPIPS